MWIRQFAIVQVAAFAALALPASEDALAARFADPPGDCRILPIRPGFGNDPAKAVRMLTLLCEKGFGGCASKIDVGTVERGRRFYVENEAAWPALEACLKYARESGLAFWLYDEYGYPSLSAGDLVLRDHPELEQTGWLIATASVVGGHSVTLDMPPGRFLAAFAVETDAMDRIQVGKTVDLSDAVRDDRPVPEPFAAARVRPFDADGRAALGLAKTRAEIRTGPLVWNAPTGASYRVYAITEDYIFEGTHCECKGMDLKFRYPNPLVKAAVERFCEVNHGAYARHLGEDLGRYFVSTFTDEPSLMGNWWRRMPYLVLSSAPGLAERYRKRTGRDLVPDIPLLVTDSSDEGRTSGDCRLAFWDESARMLEDSFFKTISSWCRKHGFLSGGHLMGEETFSYHVSCYGDFFRCLKALDAPSVDILTSTPSNVPYMTALFAGSARELTRARYTMAEVSNHRERKGKNGPRFVTADERQGTLNRLLWGGINTFTSFYDWKGISEAEVRALNLRTARASLLLRGGTSAADVALFYPAKDAMRVYRPQEYVLTRKDLPIQGLQDVFDKAGAALYADGRVFLIIDEETIERAHVDGDALVFGDLRFRAIVLPAVRTLSASARAVLSEFERKGGVVIRAEKDTDVAQEVRRVLEPHFTVLKADRKAASSLRVAHRRTPEGDVFFVMNDSSDPFTGVVTLCGEPTELRLWNLSDGTSTRVQRTPEGGVRLDLPAFRACILTTPQSCTPRRY